MAERSSRRGFLSFLLVLCYAAFAFLFIPAKVLAEDAQVVTVRVGYYENEVFQEGAKEGAMKTGYAYEYYRRISEYTGWKYEYVYGSFSELYQKLVDGEIDLLSGLAFRKDREDLIGYPSLPMGNETYSLVKHVSEEDITADPESLSGKVIGVLDSAVVEKLHHYLDSCDVSATVKTFPDYTALFTAFDAGELDLIAAEGDGAYGRDDAEVVVPFGRVDYYLCVSKEREDLLSSLNEAQEALFSEEPDYLYSLRAKYYPLSISARAFSLAEREWLAGHNELRIGYLNNYLPYSGINGQGEVKGIIKDIIPEMLASLGISHLQVSYTGFDSYDAMVSSISEGEIDLAFPVGGGLYYSEENGLYESLPVVSASTELVHRGVYTEETTSCFAVNENNRMQYYFVLTNFPEAQILFCPSIEDCLQAVLAGKATATMLNGLRANDILKNSKYKNLVMHQLARNDDHCFGVEIGNEGLLKLLNRGINVVGKDYAQNISYRYTDELYTYTLGDAFLDHLAVFAAIILSVVFVIIALLVRDRRRTLRQMKEKEAAALRLEDKNTQLLLSQKELAETDEIVGEAGFGLWHILLEEGKAPRMQGNAKMLELLGVQGSSLSEEEIYDSWYSHILPEDLPSVEKSLREMLHGHLSENTYRWEHPEKGLLYVRCGGIAKVREEHYQHLQGYHSDVTRIVKEDEAQKEALKNALAEAEHANRAKTAFLNNVSHDIRTPMNAIVGFTALASSHLESKEKVKDCLEKISVSSQHLLSLINDVLDMSRIESGKMTLDESEVHLPALIHDLRTIIQANINAKQLHFFMDTRDIVHEDIVTDKLRLNQVLLNILSNAMKFTPDGGSISFLVTEKKSGQQNMALFEFRIQDTGIGMSEEFQKTIFEAFTRERSSTVSGIQGTGLGMAITKRIVEMMGGTITLKSQEGKGSEFVVQVPCRVSSKAAYLDPIPALSGLRALVSCEEMDTCRSVCSLLKEIDMRPEGTKGREEILPRVEESIASGDAINVCILDIEMTDRQGMDLVRSIRSTMGDEVPIILLTAYDQGEIPEEAKEAGVSASLEKPLFMSELRDVLAGLFGKSEGEEKKQEKKDFAGKRVLLAEDNEMNQIIAEAILTEVGLLVDIAEDGEVAVQKMKDHPAGFYDIVFMDIQMPKKDGYEAAKEIRELEDEAKANIPIVAVTANAFEEDKKIALEAGMDSHLAKPYDIPKMMETLEKLL